MSPRKHLACSICGGRHVARGWCESHWWRWKKYGDPLGGSPIRAKPGESLRFLQTTALDWSSDECLKWPFHRTAGRGYGAFGSGRKTIYAHRWVCEAVHGPAPTDTHEAAHSCGNGHLGCVNPRHLRWATSDENKADKIRHGTQARGERIPWAKLSEHQVREIKGLLGKMPKAKIAARYGVSHGAIDGIYRGINWKWLS